MRFILLYVRKMHILYTLYTVYTFSYAYIKQVYSIYKRLYINYSNIKMFKN